MSNKIGQFRRELRGCVGRPVAYQIRDGLGAALVPVFEKVVRGEKLFDGELYGAIVDDAPEKSASREAAARQLSHPMIIPAGKGGKSTAVVSVRGVAMYDVEYQPMAFSTMLLSQTMATLGNDPEIGLIIMIIDSPGGSVTGTKEAADAVYAARQQKNVVALVNPLCASAAFWIAAQATEIVAVPSADIGSIGVFMMHAECSKMLEAQGVKPTFIFAKDSPYKVEGNSMEPLSDEAKENYQSEVDGIMKEFVRAIAKGRGVPVSKVLADFGKGRTLMAPAAKTAGLIDRVATLGQSLTRWGISGGADTKSRRGEGGEPDKNAVDAWGDILAGDGGSAIIEANDGPPRYADMETPDCMKILIIDEDNGEEVQNVVEVDCDAGYVIKHQINSDGQTFVCAGDPECLICEDNVPGDHIAQERVEGNFRTEWKTPEPAIEDVPETDLSAEAAAEKTARIDSANRRLAIKRHG